MQKIYLTQLQGDDILENIKKCESDGFTDTCRRVLKLIQDGDVEQVTKHEIKWLISKL